MLVSAACLALVPDTAQRGASEYWKATVTAVQTAQNTRSVRILSGPQQGKTVQAVISPVINSVDIDPSPYPQGSKVLVSASSDTQGKPYHAIIDYYRISGAVWLFLIIFALAVIFAGWRGFGALVGLLCSIVVITQFLIPNIVDGKAPYLITAIAIMAISVPGIYIAHGVNRRTGLALISTYVTLALAAGLAALAVAATNLTGIPNEDIWLLSTIKPDLDIRGIMLCGLLISLVGILDDITVAQTVAIDELRKADPRMSDKKLYQTGLRIGREHIASLLNTLVLVYVGASFLFIAYLSVVMPYPAMVILNSEFMMEEIVRSLVGCASLILAVPITSIIAVKFLHRKPKHNT